MDVDAIELAGGLDRAVSGDGAVGAMSWPLTAARTGVASTVSGVATLGARAATEDATTARLESAAALGRDHGGTKPVVSKEICMVSIGTHHSKNCRLHFVVAFQFQ